MPQPVMSFDGFSLVPITEADLPRIVAWRSRPEVHEWYGGRPVTEDEIRRRHLASDDPTIRCIVHLDERPIGHLQFYEYIAKWRPAIGLGPGDDGVWGIDVYLGEPDLHGQGIGTRLVRGVAERLVADFGARRVVIDPHVGNAAAIRCYQKAGFVKVRILPSYERIRGEWKDAWLMEWDGG